MTEGELAEEVRGLIRTCVPTLEALELFLALVRAPESSWSAGEVAALPGAVRLPMSAVANFLLTLEFQGILTAAEPERFRYQPATPALAEAVGGLIRAYEERPVTLIRTVYEIADSRRIQGFADAFRLTRNRDES